MIFDMVVYGKPAPAGSKKAFARVNKAGRAFATVVDDSARSRPWKQEITATAVDLMNGHPPLDGPLIAQMTFYVNRPRSHYRTGRNAELVRDGAPAYPDTKPDVLKLARAVEDALTGVVYVDDARITTEVLRKRYCAPGEPERVEVRVHADPGR